MFDRSVSFENFLSGPGWFICSCSSALPLFHGLFPLFLVPLLDHELHNDHALVLTMSLLLSSSFARRSVKSKWFED